MPTDPNGGPLAKVIIAVVGYGGRALLAVKGLFVKKAPQKTEKENKGGE